ncbi:MAG: hypothetical protein IT345_15140 [Trueperaceae bacterium]|nr:hypothetical protein [Trueperaceae bacterium]
MDTRASDLRLMPGPAEQRYLDAGARTRKRADELAEGMEALIGKWQQLETVPLDVIERVERALVRLHTSNLLRVEGAYNAPVAAPEWATGSLHDLGCSGPHLCSCEPIFTGRPA